MGSLLFSKLSVHVYIIMSFLFCAAGPNWSKNHLYIAICEWWVISQKSGVICMHCLLAVSHLCRVATFSIVLFNWTFSLDCTRLTLAEVAADTDNGEQTI